MRKTRKPLAAAIALALVAALGAGATLAWLTDHTDPVTNTFTVGNVNIDLTESDNLDLKMVPGCTIVKDPVVTVEEDSEDCWVFVKVEETGGVVSVKENGRDATKSFSDFIEYKVDPNNWKPLKDENGDGKADDGVYYCYAKDVTSDRDIKVLLNQQVKVKDTVTKEMMDALEAAYAAAYENTTGNDDVKAEAANATLPNLSFTAYAVQMAGFDTAAAAWAAYEQQNA